MLYSKQSKEDTEERATVYRILSMAFCRPTDATNQIWNALNRLESVHQEKSGCTSPSELDLKALTFEYNRLFVGPERLPAPPYESVHRKDRSEMEIGMVLGPSVLDVKRRYAEAGVAVSGNFRDLPDHITVELEFIALSMLQGNRN